jgi:hypothetical protein
MSKEQDKAFREALGGYESPVDAEALWEAVKPERKRRLGLWWIWAGMIILGIGVAVALLAPPAIALSHFPIPATGFSPQQAGSIAENVEQQPVVSPATSVAIAEHTNRGFRSAPSSLQGVAKTNRQGSPERHPDAKVLNNTPLLIPKALKPVNMQPPQLPLQSTAQLPSKIIAPLHLVIEEQEIQVNTIKPEGTRAGRWFAQAEAGLYLPLRTLQTSNSRDSSVWTTARLETETVLESVGTSLTLGYQTTKRWQIRCGIRFQQVNIRFDYSNTSTETEMRYGVSAIIQQFNQNTDTLMGETAYTIRTREEIRHYNHIRTWEVPVMLGYTFRLGPVPVLAEAGLGLRLQRARSGLVLNDAQEPQIWPDIDGYKSTFSYTLQAQAMAVLPIGQRTSILGGVSAVIEPQSYTNADAAARELYHCIGVKAGIRYRLTP